jgi:hypothetical protein
MDIGGAIDDYLALRRMEYRVEPATVGHPLLKFLLDFFKLIAGRRQLDDEIGAKGQPSLFFGYH